MLKIDPEISVIICHHKGDFIFSCVKSIQKSKDVSYEIIVVTSDAKLALNGIKGCRLIHSEALPATKRNLGSEMARGSFLAFFDDDVEIDENCLRELRNSLNDYRIMSYGKLWNMEHRDRFDEAGGYMTWSGFIWSRAGQNDIDRGQYDEPCYVLAGKSASCMVSKDAFWEVGGFDETFGILGEETDLSWRLWLKGYHIVYQPKATGYHAFNTKFKPATEYYTSKRVHFNGCRNYITMLLKNLGKEHLWIVPMHILVWFGAAIAMIVTGKLEQGVNILKGIGYVLKNLKKILLKRKLIQNGRKVDERTLWDFISHRTPRGYYLQRFSKYLSIGLHG